MISRLSSLFIATSAAFAGADIPAPVASSIDHQHHCDTAPIGVMFEHQMPAGSWMFGTRYMFQRSSGMLRGRDDISPQQVFATEAFPGSLYHAAPVEMDMHMTMFEAMWAPTDSVTLMVMTQYNSMSMTMLHGMAGPGEAGGHGGSHGGNHMSGDQVEHTVSGWGDTSLSAAIRLHQDEVHHLHLTAGLSLPTGSVSRRGHGGKFTHYMMQPGSGTFDAITGLTYTGQKGTLFWGAQYLATLRLEDEGDSGFAFGDVHNTTAWLGNQVTDWASLTARVNWRHQAKLRGHYNGPHNHASPPDLTANYGDDVVEVGLGANISLGKRATLGIEALWPVYQDVRGIQPKRDFSLNAGIRVQF
jgi:hypothetical protein